jgi:hypothetical protein
VLLWPERQVDPPQLGARFALACVARALLTAPPKAHAKSRSLSQWEPSPGALSLTGVGLAFCEVRIYDNDILTRRAERLVPAQPCRRRWVGGRAPSICSVALIPPNRAYARFGGISAVRRLHELAGQPMMRGRVVVQRRSPRAERSGGSRRPRWREDRPSPRGTHAWPAVRPQGLRRVRKDQSSSASRFRHIAGDGSRSASSVHYAAGYWYMLWLVYQTGHSAFRAPGRPPRPGALRGPGVSQPGHQNMIGSYLRKPGALGTARDAAGRELTSLQRPAGFHRDRLVRVSPAQELRGTMGSHRHVPMRGMPPAVF